MTEILLNGFTQKVAYDCRRCRAVSKGIFRLAHATIQFRLRKKLITRGMDFVGLRADQPRNARFDALGTLSGLAHDQHGLAERRRFLLYPPRICKDEGTGLH